MELEDPVCYCFHISKRKVLNYMRQHPPRVASELSQCGGAGTGCGWCIPYLKRYFEQSRTGGDLADAISKEQYARDRAAYIKAGKGTPAAGAIPLPDGESARTNPSDSTPNSRPDAALGSVPKVMK